ncbi:MAG: SPFH domain-containing protein [Flavobacteriales bacterium]|jgi:regulator of protease activity HflC (stomatin/prohibitin superfamily)|nr:SPFH domain-containing protein [Flavobacteriales bacterium]
MALPLILFFTVVLVLLSFFSVKQQTAVIIERFGKFQSIRKAGLQMKIPFIDKKAGRLSLRIEELDVMVETKTKDNVFVEIRVSVQYQVIKESVYDAFYRLSHPRDQIRSYVFDTIRAEVPKLRLDDVFENKDEIADATTRELSQAMMDYGYEIIRALVTDINPDEEVKKAMNRINASERIKKAAEYEAEAEKIKIVAKAEAEAQSKKLQGVGIADQRREIARGLEESVEMLNKVGIGSIEASSLIIVTQHYDTLQAVGENSNSNLILMPNSPSSANSLLSDMITSFETSRRLGEAEKMGSSNHPPKA